MTYDDDVLQWEQTPKDAPVYSIVYPPVGFVPFIGIGNGDNHGFYWPLGQEEHDPLICLMSHDAGSLIPQSSDIESLYRIELARSSDPDDVDDYRRVAEVATGRKQPDSSSLNVATDDCASLLNIDPGSPFLLCAMGDVHMEAERWEEAERCYRQSLTRLPEYVAAHFGLASLLRRQRRMADATIHLRMALMSPLVFWGGSFWADGVLPGSFRNDWVRKALMWLQRSREIAPSLEDDPFMNVIHRLTFQTGLAENPGIPILHSLVDEFVARNAFSDAIFIWLVIGDRAAMETTSFRERLGLTPRTYGTRLAELFRMAGYERRAALTMNMLERMEKPDGLYL